VNVEGQCSGLTRLSFEANRFSKTRERVIFIFVMVEDEHTSHLNRSCATDYRQSYPNGDPQQRLLQNQRVCIERNSNREWCKRALVRYPSSPRVGLAIPFFGRQSGDPRLFDAQADLAVKPSESGSLLIEQCRGEADTR
jgi:hypothetical protein